MKKGTLLAFLLLVSGCIPVPPSPIPPAPTTRPVAFHTCVPGASVWADGAGVPTEYATPTVTNGAGYGGFPAMPSSVLVFNLHMTAPDHPQFGQVLDATAAIKKGQERDGLDWFNGQCESASRGGYKHALQANDWQSSHFDPSTLSLTQLSHIRGAMWTARLNLPYGPFPGTDNNSIAFDFYQFYSATDRQRMVAAYKQRGYTHVVTGPLSGTDCYHNLYPCHDGSFAAAMPVDGPPTQAQFDAYLDFVQELWDNGLIPVHFAKPDGWEGHIDWMDALDRLYAQPRAQRLLRVVVYPGWEPSGSKYGWDNDTYLYWVQRGTRVFPHALWLLHTAADLDAPTGGNDETRGYTNAQSWRYVAPYIHGWLSQWGGYVFSSDCTPTADFKQALGDALSDSVKRFSTGKAGWPTDSAWGKGKPVMTYDAEDASYIYFGKGCEERHSLDLGDIAVRAGSFGYLDGGRLAPQ